MVITLGGFPGCVPLFSDCGGKIPGYCSNKYYVILSHPLLSDEYYIILLFPPLVSDKILSPPLVVGEKYYIILSPSSVVSITLLSPPLVLSVSSPGYISGRLWEVGVWGLVTVL